MTIYRGVPPWSANNIADWARAVTVTTNGNLNGKTNNTGYCTLGASTVSTTVVLAEGRLGNDTVLLFQPTTASAATEAGAGSMFVSTHDVAGAKFVLTHASTAQADKIFKYILVGG